MVRTIEAVYDGKVLCPKGPLVLEPNTRVRITIEAADGPTVKAASFLDTARSLSLDGPRDWAVNLDTYLYGGEGQDDV